jgi:hypothetical protein
MLHGRLIFPPTRKKCRMSPDDLPSFIAKVVAVCRKASGAVGIAVIESEPVVSKQ